LQLSRRIYQKLVKEFMLEEEELELVEIKTEKRTQTVYVEFRIRYKGKTGRYWAIIEKQNKNLILAFWHPLEE